MTKKPLDWGEDSLSKEIDDRHENIYSIFHHQRKIFDLLISAQVIFEKLRKDLEGLNEEEPNVVFFPSMSYGAFLGAVRLALGGQLPPAYMVMRGCLESALYAFRIYKNPELFNIYINRHKGDSGKKDSRDEFQLARIFLELKKDSPGIETPAKNLYDFIIDLGAHPNVKAITTNLDFDEEEKELRYYYVTDLLKDAGPFVQCIEALVQTTAYSLKIFELIFPNAVSDLGLSNKIEELTKTRIMIEE